LHRGIDALARHLHCCLARQYPPMSHALDYFSGVSANLLVDDRECLRFRSTSVFNRTADYTAGVRNKVGYAEHTTLVQHGFSIRGDANVGARDDQFRFDRSLIIGANDVRARRWNENVAIDTDDGVTLQAIAAAEIGNSAAAVDMFGQCCQIQSVAIVHRAAVVRRRDQNCATVDEESRRVLAYGTEALHGNTRAFEA
jgi:hypothetical protein